jgi:hypothetical protein
MQMGLVTPQILALQVWGVFFLSRCIRLSAVIHLF